MAYYAVTYSDELYHHGIKGQKWGVRRYRNEDGTLTELGKRRIGGGKKDKRVDYDKKTGRILDDDSRENAERKIHQQVAQDYQSVANAANSAANFARTGSNLANRTSQRRQQKARDAAKSKIDVSNMSNKELQDAITRMNLERQYKDLKTSDLATGRSGVSDILADAGDVLAMAASAASIAYVFYQMTH